VGSAGAGKSVLLSSWAAARSPGVTSWLSCDEADADPVRFWTGFIEAPQVVAPRFGADAADLLALEGVMSADVAASIANDAAKLPAGSAVIVDDFHFAAPGVSANMTDLVERWPTETAQLVLAGRSDPPLRLYRLRMAGELCELRDRDLYFSLAESRDLLANFGVEITAADLALLHQRSEGWAAALQMAALSLHGTKDPVRAARAFEVRSHENRPVLYLSGKGAGGGRTPAYRGEGGPVTPGRQRKIAPAWGWAARLLGSQSNQEVVMYRSPRSVPPKATEVGLVAGSSITPSRVPSAR